MRYLVGLSLFTLLSGSVLSAQQRPTSSYGKAPLAFERNAGQTATQVKYLSRGKDYSLFLTPNEATFALRKNKEGAVVKMQLLGSNPNAKETAFGKLPGTTNYFIGKDKSQWRTGVANYSKVGFSGVYKGVDVVYYGNQKNLEYDFIVQPNASPSSIRLKFAGAKRVTSSKGGTLSLDMGNGSLEWHAPVAYQELEGKRVPVSAKYLLKGTEVAFAVGSYDTTKPLVIDPELVYSTYLGG